MAKSTKVPAGKGKGPSDPEDDESFGKWLEEQPRECLMTIASRAASRVLPLVSDGDDISASVLRVFRAIAISRFAAKYLNYEPSAAAAASAASQATLDAVKDSAATAAGAAASVAARGAKDLRTSAMDAAFAVRSAAASAKAVGAGPVPEVDAAVKHDAKQLHDRSKTPEQLAAAPLWLAFSPARIGGAWQGLARELRARGDHWSIWIDWYDDVIAGSLHAMTAEAEDAAFTDVPGRLPWDDGAEAVNLEIARRLKALRPDPAPVEGIPQPDRDQPHG